MILNRHPKVNTILVINCGSSSLKAHWVDPVSGLVRVRAMAERLREPGARFLVKVGEAATEILETPGSTHAGALEFLLERFAGIRPCGIGHRVVHGGEFFRGSVRIDEGVEAKIEQCIPLAPLHNPANLVGIRLAAATLPGLPQVAVFDTAFHQTIPPEAFHYAIPRRFYSERGVRRYGFHGTSHQFVAAEAAARLGRDPLDLQLLTAHLGNGCSACAVRGGRSADTTMGLTPLEGLVMGTRSGDIDPSLVPLLAEWTRGDAASVLRMLSNESGLLGLSGISNDMRTLAEAADAGHAAAELAIQVFCHRLAKGLLGLTASLERVDALVFTGGIGENSSAVRARTLEKLSVLGVSIDPAANALHGKKTGGRISPAESAGPAILVVPTNEEWMIARETFRLLDAVDPIELVDKTV